jgi:hypothetical protein
MTISLPGTWPTAISGERSIEKINTASAASVLTKEVRKIMAMKIKARVSLEENPIII